MRIISRLPRFLSLFFGLWLALFVSDATAACHRIVLDSISNGGNGGSPTYLYKSTGNASWYSNSGCTNLVTNLTNLPNPPSVPPSGLFMGYNTSVTGNGTMVIDSTGELSSNWLVYSDTTIYAIYNCNLTLYKRCNGSLVGAGIADDGFVNNYYRDVTDSFFPSGWGTCSGSTFMGWCDVGLQTPGNTYKQCNNRPKALWCKHDNVNYVNTSVNENAITGIMSAELVVAAGLLSDVEEAGEDICNFNVNTSGYCPTFTFCLSGYCVNVNDNNSYGGLLVNVNQEMFVAERKISAAWAKCIPCTNTLPTNAHWTSSGNEACQCAWECNNGYVVNPNNANECVLDGIYVVSYNCGISTGTPPQSHTALSIGNTFVARANTSNNCVVPVGYEFSGWRYSGDYNVYTSGSTITFNSPSNQTMTALYDRCAISISWNSGVINSGESYGTNGNGTIDFAWIFSRNTTYQNMNSSFFLPANTTVNNSNNSFTTYQSLCSGLDCRFYGGNTTNGTGLIMPAYTWRAPGYAPIAWLCTGTSSGDNYFIWQPGDNATIMYYDSTNQVCNDYFGKSMCAPLWTPLCATGNYTQSSTGVFYSATNHSYVRPYLNIARGGPYPYTTPISTNHSVAYETRCESGYTISSGANTACPVCVRQTYQVSYDCGIGTGTPPQTHTGLSSGDTFVAHANTSNNCVVPVGYEFAGWEYSGNNTTYAGGSTITFNSTSNQIMTAQYKQCNLYIKWNSGVIGSSDSYGVNGNGTANFVNNLFLRSGDNIFYLPSGTIVNNSNSTFTTYQSSCSGLDCTFYGGNTTNGTGLIMPQFTWSHSGHVPVAWHCAEVNGGGRFVWQPGDNATTMYYIATHKECRWSNVICVPLWAPLCTTNTFTYAPNVFPRPAYHSSAAHSYVSPYLSPRRGGLYQDSLSISSNHWLSYNTWCEYQYTMQSGAGTACPVCEETLCPAGTYLENEECKICPNNYWSDAGWTTCHACDVENGYVNGAIGNWHGTALQHAGVTSCKTNCLCGSRVSSTGAPCRPTGKDTYATAHSVPYSFISEQHNHWDDCAFGLYSSGYGAGADESNDCGKVLHTKRPNGFEYGYYLRQNRLLPQGTRDIYGNIVKLLKVKYNNTEWCADLTTVSNDNLRLKLNNMTYFIYAPRCDWEVDFTDLDRAIDQACKIHFPYYYIHGHSPLDTPTDPEHWSMFSSSWRVEGLLAEYSDVSEIHGMSACLQGYYDFDEYKALDINENFLTPDPDSKLDACFCKTVNPMFSAWVKPSVLIGENQASECAFDQDVLCRDFCQLSCALSMIQDEDFRKAIQSNIITGTQNNNPQNQVSPNDWRDLYDMDYGSAWY